MEYGPKEGKFGLKIIDYKNNSYTNWYISKSERDKEFKKQNKLKNSPSTGIKDVKKTSR